MRKFVGGIDIDRMILFLALTYYMGLIKKKPDIKQYWSMDEMLSTSFVRNIMSRDEYHNILSFFHLCDNSRV